MPAYKFDEKTIIVTGASRGLGLHISAAFARCGAMVVMADIDEEEGQAAAANIRDAGHRAEFVRMDLADTENTQDTLSSLLSTHGHVDVLINNARAGERTEPLQETEANLSKTTSVMMAAPLFASQIFIHSAAQTGRAACIVNISSVAAQVSCHESASYHMSKAALESLTRYLAACGGRENVRVNAVRPGFIVQDDHRERYAEEDNADYRRVAEFCHPLGCVGSSDDVSNVVLFLSSDQSAFVTGQIITVDGGLTIQDPWYLTYRFHRSPPT